MFKKYTSIENSYQKSLIEQIQMQGYWKDEYVVQEKVHGANLSFWTTDGQHFQAAKRTADITAEEVFNNYEQVQERLISGFQGIWKDLQQQLPDIEQVTIYGEIMGGSYPHPDVEKVKNSIRVQKGVFYCPGNEFYAFDIKANDSYLDVELCNQLFEKYNLLYARTLFKGSIEECLQYPNDFNSTIPAQLGLPLIEPNVVEGTVIKPVKTRYFRSGSRLIIKNKNEKWSEVKKVRTKVEPQAPIPEKVIALQKALGDYCTENRLNNVLSKIGNVGIKDFGRVMGLYSKDVMEDFQKDHEAAFADLEKQEQKLVTKSLAARIAPLIRKRLVEEQ